jgi:hypothetical protein
MKTTTVKTRDMAVQRPAVVGCVGMASRSAAALGRCGLPTREGWRESQRRGKERGRRGKLRGALRRRGRLWKPRGVAVASSVASVAFHRAP